MFMRGGRLKLSKDGEFSKNIESLLDDDYRKRRIEFLETKLNEKNVDLNDDIELKFICEECGSDNVKTVLNLKKFVEKHSSESHCKGDINADVKEVLEFIANALKKKRALNIKDYLTEVVELKLWKLKNTMSTNSKVPDPEQPYVKAEENQVIPFPSQTIDYDSQINIDSIKNLFGNLFISSPLEGLSMVFDCSLSSCNVPVKETVSKTVNIVEIPEPMNDNGEFPNGEEINGTEDESDKTKNEIFEFKTDNFQMLQRKHLIQKENYEQEITAAISPILEETEEQFEGETKGDTDENCENIDEKEEITQFEVFLENEESQVKFEPPKEEPKKVDSPNKREIKAALSKFRVCVENFLSSDKEEEEKYMMNLPEKEMIGDACPSPTRSKRSKREKLSIAEPDITAKRLREMNLKKEKEREKKIPQEKLRTQCSTGAYAPAGANSITSLPISNKSFYMSIFGAAKGPKQKTIFSTNSKNIHIRKSKESNKEMQSFDRGHSVNRCTILETISDCKEEDSNADADSPTRSHSKKTLLIKIPSVESCSSKQQINRNINRNIKIECKKNVDKIYSLIEPQRSPLYVNRDNRDESPEPCSWKQIKGRHSHLKVKREKPKQEKFDRFEVDRPSIDSLTYRLEEKRCIETKKGKKLQKRSSPRHSPTGEDCYNFYIEEGRKSPPRRLDTLAQPKKSYVEANSELLRKKTLRNVEMERLLDSKRVNGPKRMVINSDSFTTSESLNGSIHNRRKTTDKETSKQVINSCESANMLGCRRKCGQNLKDSTKSKISTKSAPFIDMDVRTSVENILDVDDITPKPSEKYACGEGVSILYENIDLIVPAKHNTEDISKNEPRETQTSKMIVDYGTGDSLSVELVQMSKEIMRSCAKEISLDDERKVLIENLSKAFEDVERRKLQKFKEFCSLFWPAGDASISTENTFDFGNFFDKIATPVLTVAYSFPVHENSKQFLNNFSTVEPLRRPVEHDIPTEIYNRNLPRNESSDSGSNFESVSTGDIPAFKPAKEEKPSSKNVDVGNDRSETACVQTRNVFHEDKVVYVDFPEREFFSRCVDVQSVFLKPVYLKNHPSLEALFREGSKMIAVAKSEQNFNSSLCRISPSIKKISLKNVQPVESHPLIEMFKRPSVQPDAIAKPNNSKVKKQKRLSRKHNRVMHKQRAPNDMKKKVLLAVYTVLVMSVFAAMSYPDVLVLQNSFK